MKVVPNVETDDIHLFHNERTDTVVVFAKNEPVVSIHGP